MKPRLVIEEVEADEFFSNMFGYNWVFFEGWCESGWLDLVQQRLWCIAWEIGAFVAARVEVEAATCGSKVAKLAVLIEIQRFVKGKGPLERYAKLFKLGGALALGQSGGGFLDCLGGAILCSEPCYLGIEVNAMRAQDSFQDFDSVPEQLDV